MRALALTALALAGCSPEFWRPLDIRGCEPTGATRTYEYETCDEGECTTREVTQHRYQCPDGRTLWI